MDVRPPVLVRTEPDTFATLSDLGARVRFVFDERISETVSGGELSNAVTVSPRTGEVRVRHERNAVTVQVEGGFRPGILYRVTLLPVVRDMFGNQLRDPFELVFSTGGVPSPTAVAGQAWSRTTGQGSSGALVRAVSEDSLVYVARADQAGIYALRYLPDGTYEISAFEDANRDGELDARETQGSVSAVISAGDTLLLDVPMLPYDTTPAMATSARPLDSLTIALEFDDYLDEGAPADEVVVALRREDGIAPAVARVFHEREYGAYVDQVADSLMRLDSIEAAASERVIRLPADSAAAGDSAVAAPDARTPGGVAPAAAQGPSSRRQGPPRLQGQGGRRSGRQLPTRRLVARLVEPLARDVEYEATISGVRNLNGIEGGGGAVVLLLRAPEVDVPTQRTPGGDPAQPPGGAAGAGPQGGAGGFR